MREWILQNTEVTQEEYDKLLNLNTVRINGKSNVSQNDKISNHPMVNIVRFTSYKPTYSHRRKYKVKRKKDVNKHYYYIYEKIKFYILGEIFSIIEEKCFCINRQSNCFYINSDTCLLPKINSYLITAMCISPFRTKQNPYIHTFTLLITPDGLEYILDGTSNVIMDKKTYYSIYKPEIISCIPKEILKEELNLLKPFEEDERIYRAEYLCFRDKIMESVKKLTRKK